MVQLKYYTLLPPTAPQHLMTTLESYVLPPSLHCLPAASTPSSCPPPRSCPRLSQTWTRGNQRNAARWAGGGWGAPHQPSAVWSVASRRVCVRALLAGWCTCNSDEEQAGCTQTCCHHPLNATAAATPHATQVGVRLPDDPVAQALLAQLDRPLLCSTVSSADGASDDGAYAPDAATLMDRYGNAGAALHTGAPSVAPGIACTSCGWWVGAATSANSVWRAILFGGRCARLSPSLAPLPSLLPVPSLSLLCPPFTLCRAGLCCGCWPPPGRGLHRHRLHRRRARGGAPRQGRHLLPGSLTLRRCLACSTQQHACSSMLHVQ